MKSVSVNPACLSLRRPVGAVISRPRPLVAREAHEILVRQCSRARGLKTQLHLGVLFRVIYHPSIKADKGKVTDVKFPSPFTMFYFNFFTQTDSFEICS